MLTAIIIVLLWVVPVVIHAGVVSRKKYGFFQFTVHKYPKLETKADEAPIYLHNIGMIIPQQPYYPNARWRTHHGMIDLHYSEEEDELRLFKELVYRDEAEVMAERWQRFEEYRDAQRTEQDLKIYKELFKPKDTDGKS